MRTLDIARTLTAMRERPGDFEMAGKHLRHKASRHVFLTHKGRLTHIEAPCSCAQLRVDALQAVEFGSALASWTELYWRPLQIERTAELRAAQINRQFAAHFRPPNRLKRLRLRLADTWRAAAEAFRRPTPGPLNFVAAAEPDHSVSAAPHAPARERVDA